MNFTSDNIHGVLPQVMQAIKQANDGNTANPYGGDSYTDKLHQTINELFETKTSIFLTATGTGSNAISLSAITKKYGLVCCSKSAHINCDEAGAPEALMGGGRICPISDNSNAKISADELQSFFNNAWLGEKHHMQASAVSISNLSEHGCAYSPEEVKAIAKICKSKNMYLHMDGARFANAIVGMNTTPADITWKSGVDILSFGLTKLGGLMAEVIVVFNDELSPDLKFLHKRGSQLVSKSRFISAQILTFLHADLWLKTARSSNEKATKLAQLAQAKGYKLLQPVNGNQVFLQIDQQKRNQLYNAGVQFYVFTSLGQNACRFVTAFTTTDTDIDNLINLL